MSNYTKNTNFTAKDNLTSGDPAKVIKGAEFDTEFNALQTAVNSKADSNNSQLTGTTDAQAVETTGDVTVGGNLSVTGNATIAGNLTFGDADTDTVSFSADIDSNIIPDDNNTYDLGSATKQWRNVYVDGTAYVDTVNLNGTDISATAAEINKLDGLTATTTELNYTDGVTSNIQTQLDSMVEKAGDTMTGDLSLGDGVKATFGASDDLQIYHDGSTSYIDDSGTGNLVIKSEDFYVYGSATLEPKIRAITNAEVGLYYNGSEKLATTATGVDVTGTVTADGLTVDGGGTIQSNASSSVPTLTLKDTDTAISVGQSLGRLSFSSADNSPDAAGERAYIKGLLEDGGTAYGLELGAMVSGGSPAKRLSVSGSGDVHLYEDTGTTAKFVWDASEEQLSLTGSVSGKVPFRTYSGGYSADYNSYSAEEGFQVMSYQSVGGSPYTKTSDLIANADGTAPSEMRLLTKSNGSSNPTERLRIDSLGNLLVGTTTANLHTTSTEQGARLYDGGIITSGNGTCAYFNRITTDGTILDLRKDGSTVGSIGSYYTDFYVGKGDTGLSFSSVNNRITPSNVDTGGFVNGAIDLGYSGGRFKDLYLSGGVYLGGTGAANKLDDYEEGVWTPNAGGLTLNYSNIVSSGTYTKIGNTVYIKGSITWDTVNAGSGASYLAGLPFVPNAICSGQVIVCQNGNAAGAAYDQLWSYVVPDLSRVYFRVRSNGTATGAANKNELWAGSGNALDITMVYTTDS